MGGACSMHWRDDICIELNTEGHRNRIGECGLDSSGSR
jgi:hypothetical protein